MCNSGAAGVARKGLQHRNEAWWSCQVACAQAESVLEPCEGSETERFYKFVDEHGKPRWIKTTRMLLTGPPDLGDHAGLPITGFVEVRQPYWHAQPHHWITYHAFLLLEVADGLFHLLVERKTDQLELVIGSADIPPAFMKAFRAYGPGRNPSRCVDEPFQAVTTGINIQQLLGWIDGPVEERWEPYDLLKANCQSFVADVRNYLLNPGAPQHYAENPLKKVPVEALQDRSFAMSTVQRNPRALKYLPEKWRRDWEVVLAAVAVDGNALRYASEELRADRHVAIMAVKQYGYALPYVHPFIRQDRELVLTAVKQNGYVLCYCADYHREDREVVVAAVRQDGYAIRYAAGKLRFDLEVLLAASMQNPVAVARSTFLF